MTDNRKNLKLKPESYQLMRDAKHKHETWDHMIHRVFGNNNE